MRNVSWMWLFDAPEKVSQALTLVINGGEPKGKVRHRKRDFSIFFFFVAFLFSENETFIEFLGKQ